MKKLFLLLLAVLAMAVGASAQTRTVTGTVVDAVNDGHVVLVAIYHLKINFKLKIKTLNRAPPHRPRDTKG